MIVRSEHANGRQIEIHEERSGHRRYWAAVNHQAIYRQGSLRPRLFATSDAAWTAALREAEISPRTPGPPRVPGYSNPGGGGPFAPMATPRAPHRPPARRRSPRLPR